ncbi:MAG TPA: DUF5367 family protein [Rhizomicrobium sp.]|nr:DUF5367 family protein [Rhizomicrobium sp.]
MPLSDRDLLIYAAAGFAVWLFGALEFRWLGGAMFENGALITALAAASIALSVCLLYRSAMRWRGTAMDQAVTVAVVMALPGLFGEAARQLVFGWATGLKPETEPAFVATIIFGNAVLLAYAVFRQRAAG